MVSCHLRSVVGHVIHYCIKFSHAGCFVCKRAIQLSSVLSLTFMFSFVWATIQAVTSRNECSPELKWRDTGLKLFPCLMSAMCPLSLSLNVFPDCPTYCSPCLTQLIT